MNNTYAKCDITDHSKLDIRGDKIHCVILQQDGYEQPMVYKDTPFNRLFVAWLQIYDRYGNELPS